MNLQQASDLLTAAAFVAGVWTAVGVFLGLCAWSRRPAASQQEREHAFLLRQTALHHAQRRDWRDSFTGSIDEFKTRDAA